MKDKIKSSVVINFLGSASAFFYLLPWLMIIVFTGTIAQKYIGLYEAEKFFFSSFILWAGYIPLPAGYSTLGFLVLCIVTNLIFKSHFTYKNLGINIAHLGVFLLIIGGILTAFYSEEGYISIAPNETRNLISDYHEREFVILNGNKEVFKIPFKHLISKEEITSSELPFKIKIEDFCYNCEISERRHVNIDMHGLAARFYLEPKELYKDNENNNHGITFKIFDSKIDKEDFNNNGLYVAFESMTEAQYNSSTEGNNSPYKFIVRKKLRTLPFDIELVNFVKQTYPGTNSAKNYYSEIIIHDQEKSFLTLIEMNHPLRFKGYTLYQSSYTESNGKIFSVFTVVKNLGAMFPYISTIVLTIGLLLHIIINYELRVNKKESIK